MILSKNQFVTSVYNLSQWSLGLAFLLSGIRKLPGIKFTQLPIDNPVGLFFEGMYATGIYWHFIGLYQMVVGLWLLLGWMPRLTPLVSIPVTINIFLVSVGLHMSGTPIITGLMLLANSFLIIFHWPSYAHLFQWKAKITVQ